jgi:hypothetical protein
MALDAEPLPGAGGRAEVTGSLYRGVLPCILFLVCLGLGYPTLNRYDIRLAVPDAADYTRMVETGPEAARPAYRARVLVPYLARPFARIARGHVGSWNPTSFGLLIANSLLTAGAAYILATIGFFLTGSPQTAILAALLYLLNFAVANLMLAGIVDSGEAFFLTAAVAVMLRKRWSLLPLIAVPGAASKETFIPFLAAMAGTWAMAEPRRRSALLWTVLSLIIGLAVVTTLLSLSTGHLAYPWQLAAELSSSDSPLRSALACVTNRTFWYVFIWLLPVGLLKIGRLPRPWVVGCGTAAIVAIALSAYHNQPEDAAAAARALYNIAGPMLSLSAALALAPPLDRNPGGQRHPC